jgi:glutamate-1-semialdehyde 2,1-aminomutase
MTNNAKSAELFERAKKLMPGGVNSPVRAFNSVGGTPPYFEKASGPKVIDADGNEYVDFCGSWGPLILGHAHPKVVEAVSDAASNGLSFGACCRKEVEMAELLSECVPYLEMMRMVNSGTEAVMSALRLARGYTGRNKILKFEGCYHGHADYLLVSAGSGLLTGGIASSDGVAESAVADVLVAPYNDIEAVENIFASHGNEIAAVIVEPIAGNMGLIKPMDGFLESLRELTIKSGSVLIFDEVISGFRLSASTYGNIVGITPDLTTMGKIIGGGMPIGAFGGKAEIMKNLAPLGKVYQAGTLSGNPVALAAGIATIKTLKEEDPYPEMEKLAKKIESSVSRFGVHCDSLGGMFTVFFTDKKPLKNLGDVKGCDTDAFAAFHKKMLERGYYLSPSQFELNFVSAAHTEEIVDSFMEALVEIIDQ